MIGEILTGIFAGATFVYLYARKKHYDRASQDPVEPVDKVTFTASAAPKHEHYWWQEFGSSKYTNQQKLPETKEKLEAYLKNHMNNHPPPVNGPEEVRKQEEFMKSYNNGRDYYDRISKNTQ
jgi:hypothetical protein